MTLTMTTRTELLFLLYLFLNDFAKIIIKNSVRATKKRVTPMGRLYFLHYCDDFAKIIKKHSTCNKNARDAHGMCIFLVLF